MKPKRPHSSKPRLSTKKKSKLQTIKYALTPEEMYKLDSHQLDYGIDGYQIVKKYNDHHQCVWARKREAILKAHKHIWPPEDWPRSKDDETVKVKPKRKTFLDDLYKWCYSYYDKEKAEALIEEKNINVNDYVKPLKIDKKRRTDFLENEKKKEEWRKSRPAYYEHMQNAVEEIQEKLKQEESEKIDPIEKIRKRYKQKPQTARCDRVSVVSEAQYLGEQVPFYNTFVPEDGELDKKKLFFPSKHYTWKRAPAWKYPKDIGPNVEFQKEEKERMKEKIEEYMNDKDLKKEDLWMKVVDSYHKVTHHGELPIKFQPIYKMKETEQYVAMLENQPRVYIGPQQYWKMPKETFSKYRQKKPNLSSITDDNGNKIYYMDRKKTDKRVYSAGMRKAVY
jgi:hypothetical protein